MTMLESVMMIDISLFQHGKHDVIGRQFYDTGRQHESQSSDWQQITECVKMRNVQYHRVNAVVFYAFHMHDNHSFVFA